MKNKVVMKMSYRGIEVYLDETLCKHLLEEKVSQRSGSIVLFLLPTGLIEPGRVFF